MENNVLFICNGTALIDENNLSLSGGDLRLFEIAKNIKGFNKYFLLAYYGDKILATYPEIKYENKYIINYKVDPSVKTNLLITLMSLFSLPQELKDYHGIVYSSCEHLYDVLPAVRLKATNKCKWYAVNHLIIPPPWKSKRGGTPFLIRYIYWLNRLLSLVLIKYFADEVLAVSKQTKKTLINSYHFKKKKVKAVFCGVDVNKINTVRMKYSSEKGTKYDAVYLKRLSHSKGAFDLVDIWEEVCKSNKVAKLAVIGYGSETVINQLRLNIQKANLQNNVILLGPINDFEKKYRMLNSSKVFIMPSYEENWGIALGEAMATGLPTIAYKLKEIYPIWKDKTAWVKTGNTKTFAKKILAFLDDENLRTKFSEDGIGFIKSYDWNNIAKHEMEI